MKQVYIHYVMSYCPREVKHLISHSFIRMLINFNLNICYHIHSYVCWSPSI